MANIAPRPYQVVVWGASGFTGRLVCEHIARDYQGKIRWAMAGRDAKKLEQVRSDLSRINPSCKDVPILTADARDRPGLGGVVSQAAVVLSTVGPFARYGDALVEAAVERGTHYADITGEVPWVKRSIQRHHTTAASRGVKVLHCCGYDSVPSDLGTFMMVDYCRKELGCGVSQMYTLVGPGSGGFSGGTLESAVNLLVNESTSELAAVNGDQYYLAALHGLPHGSDRPAGVLPHYVTPARTWAGPFLMEGVNAKIVQASNALFAATTSLQQEEKGQSQQQSQQTPTAAAPEQRTAAGAGAAGGASAGATQGGFRYGADFKYCEALATGSALTAGLVSAATVLVGAVFMVPPLRALARRFLPSPGEGPSEEARRKGHWRHDLVAVTDEERPRVVRGHCGDRRDPGYWSTSRMLLETGLCLALEGERLEADARLSRGGVLTAAAACGPVLLERLRAAGFSFEVEGVQKA